MSFIHLLSVGKSLTNVRGEPSRFTYATDESGFIPNLQQTSQSKSHQIASKQSAESSEVPSVTYNTLPAERKSPLFPPSTKVAASSPANLNDSIVIPLGEGKEFSPLSSSFAKKFFFRWLGPLNPNRKAASKVRGGARLEVVQVVRNDLMEVDFEFVQAKGKSPITKRAVRGSPATNGGQVSKQSWSRLAARLFEAGRSWT